MRRSIVLAVLIAVGAGSIVGARAQQNPAAIRIEKVRENLFVITGGRGTGAQSGTVAGNTTVFVTDTGVVLVDTKFGGMGQAILDQVKSVTNKPVTTIINTHSHGDHTGGNADFGRTVEFVVHHNTQLNMSRMDEFKGERSALLPTKTFGLRMSLLEGRNQIDLYHFGRAHTDGDAIIVFPALRTAVMGDLFARKWAPLVDSNNGGSMRRYPRTIANAISRITNVETVITGHGTTTVGSAPDVSFVRSNPVMTWADLQEYSEFLRDFVASVDALKRAGKTADQAVNELKLPAKYSGYNMSQSRADVQKLYEEPPLADDFVARTTSPATGAPDSMRKSE